MSESSMIKDTTELLEIKCATSDAITKTERGSPSSWYKSMPSDPNYPNNWREGRHGTDNKQTGDEDKKLSLYEEQQMEGATIYQNQQAPLGLHTSARNNSVFLTPSASSMKCCGSKVLVSVLSILVLLVALLCFAALTLAINNYTNEKDRFDQLEEQIKKLRTESLQDRKLQDITLSTMNIRINTTVSNLASHLQALLPSENLLTRISNLEINLRQANETHIASLQSQSESLATKISDLEIKLYQANTSLLSQMSTSKSLTMRVSDLETRLRLANETHSALLASQISTSEIMTIKMSDLEMQLHLANQNHNASLQSQMSSSENLVTRMSDLEMQLHRVNATHVTALQSQMSTMTTRMSDFEKQLRRANKTHTTLLLSQISTRANLDSRISTVNEIQLRQANLTHTALLAASESLNSRISDLKIKLRLVNETQTASLQSQMFTSESLVTRMSGLEIKLSLANETHTLTLQSQMSTSESLATRISDLEIKLANKNLTALLESTRECLITRISDLESKLRQVNQTYTASQIYSESMNYRISDLESKLRQVNQTHTALLESTSEGLITRISDLESKLRQVNQTQISTSESLDYRISDLEIQLRQANRTHTALLESTSEGLITMISHLRIKVHNTLLEIDSLNSSSVLMGNAVNSLSTSLHSVQEEFVFLNTALNSTKSTTDWLLMEIIRMQRRVPAIEADLDTLGNQLNTTRADLGTLQDHITAIQADSTRMLSSFDNRLNMTTIKADLQVSSLQKMLYRTNAQMNSTVNTITSLKHNHVLTKRALNTTNSNLKAIQAEFRRISSAFNGLNGTLKSSVNLYGACYKDKVNCSVYRHQLTPYWYRCTTAAIRINTPNYYTMSTHCQHDPDASYVDTTSIEVLSGNFVRCHCNVLGLTTFGTHTGIFSPIPHGSCALVVTRCPMTQEVFRP